MLYLSSTSIMSGVVHCLHTWSVQVLGSGTLLASCLVLSKLENLSVPVSSSIKRRG